jgi:hypothetical protein
MSQIYQYQERVSINSNKETIIEYYLDKDLRKHWQKNLIDVKPLSLDHLGVGRVYELSYRRENGQMKMKETILALDLPNSFDVLYEVKGVKNICKNQLIEINGFICWSMQVEFEFEEEVSYPINQFKASTRQSMEALKNYLEIHQ